MKTLIIFLFLFAPTFCLAQCDSTDFAFMKDGIEHYGWLVNCPDSAFVKIDKSNGEKLFIPPLPKQNKRIKFISAGRIYVQIKIGRTKWQYYYGEESWVKSGHNYVPDIH